MSFRTVNNFIHSVCNNCSGLIGSAINHIDHAAQAVATATTCLFAALGGQAASPTASACKPLNATPKTSSFRPRLLFTTLFAKKLFEMEQKKYISSAIAADLLKSETVRSPFTFYRRVDLHVRSHALSFKSAFYILRAFDETRHLETVVTQRMAKALHRKEISSKDAYQALQTYRVVRNDAVFADVIGKTQDAKRAKLIIAGNCARQLSNSEYAVASERLRKQTYKTEPPVVSAPRTFATVIEVWNLSTFKSAQKLVNEGYNPAVLNMANEKHPGGGFLTGASAQEEQLCRQSNLYEGLEFAQNGGMYPWHPFEVIVTPKTTFFRDDEYRSIAPFQVDVIGSAAYICAGTSCNRPQSDLAYQEGMKRKIRSMFRAAILQGNDSLLLSAFGCGAFKNDPRLISQWYKEVLAEPEFVGAFSKVVFGIIDDRNGANFRPFKETFDSRYEQ